MKFSVENRLAILAVAWVCLIMLVLSIAVNAGANYWLVALPLIGLTLIFALSHPKSLNI